MNPQLYPPVMERCLAAGALDVDDQRTDEKRPGIVLSVLAAAAKEAELSELLIRRATTLGVRVHAVHRHEASRQITSVTTPFGDVHIKLKRLDGKIIGRPLNLTIAVTLRKNTVSQYSMFFTQRRYRRDAI